MSRSNLTDANDSSLIQHDHNHDGIDRRGFLKCMAWAGAGTLCVVEGGVLKSYALAIMPRGLWPRVSSALCKSATVIWDSVSLPILMLSAR